MTRYYPIKKAGTPAALRKGAGTPAKRRRRVLLQPHPPASASRPHDLAIVAGVLVWLAVVAIAFLVT